MGGGSFLERSERSCAESLCGRLGLGFYALLFFLPDYVGQWCDYCRAYSNRQKQTDADLHQKLHLLERKLRRHRRQWLALLFFTLVFGWFWIWAVVKFIAALFCPDHMFNLFHENSGCVDLSMFKCFQDP